MIVKMLNIRNSKSGKNKIGAHLINALEYISDPVKTQNGELIRGHNCIASPNAAAAQMFSTKKRLNSNGKRQAYHFILSCPEGEGSAELMIALTEKFLKEYLGNYEALYAVHTNTEKMHSHIIFNSVSFVTGKKFRYEKGDFEKEIKPLIDKLCVEYGISELFFDEKEEKENRKKNHRKKLKIDIDEAIENAKSYEDFLNQMKEKKYKINFGKYLAMKPEDGERYLRTKSLGETYTEDMIKLRVAMNNGSIKKYTYCYKPRIKMVKANYVFMSRIKYQKKNEYQKWLVKKYVKLKRISNYNLKNNWKNRDAIKKLRQAQEEYLFVKKNNIHSPKELEEKLLEKQKLVYEVNIERKKFLTEKNIYQDLFDKYYQLMKLQSNHDYYLEDENKIFKNDYDEYEKIKAEITAQGYTIEDIVSAMENINHKEKGYNIERTDIYKDIRILERLIKKNIYDSFYNMQLLKENSSEELNNMNTGLLENNFRLWSESRIANSYTFDEVMNHNTENDYSRDNFYIICDRLNPNNYLKVKSTREVFEGEEYTKSYYEIFQNNEKVTERNDGRFAGRKKDFWYNLKKEIKNAAGLGDDNIIFENEANFIKYQEAYETYKGKEIEKGKKEKKGINI